MATKRTIDKIELAGITTDGTTAVVLGTFVIPTGSAVSATLHIVGRDTANGNTVTAKQSTGVSNIAGVVALVGSIVSILPVNGDAAIVTSVVTFDVSGTSLRAKVTGVTLKNIEWWGYMEVIVN